MFMLAVTKALFESFNSLKSLKFEDGVCALLKMFMQVANMI